MQAELPMSGEQCLMNLIDRRADQIVKLTQELVRIPSVNTPPTGDEKQCQLYIADKLKSLGLKVDVFTPEEVSGLKESPYYNPGRDYTGRPNIVGTLKGTGGGRSLLLTGHVDVVSPGGADRWRYPPWDAVVEDGRIYGCGSADMKAGLAAQIMAIQCILESGVILPGDVYMASVVDEEFGGMNGSLACIMRGYRADAGIISEPTQLTIQPGSAGGIQYTIRVKGRTAFEGEKEKGVSAVEKMYAVIQALSELEERRNRKGRQHPLFSTYTVPSPIVVISVQGGDSQVGGVPDRCEIDVWHGAIPGESEDDVMEELRISLSESLSGDCWLKANPPEVRPVIKWIDPCDIAVDHPIVREVESSLRKAIARKAQYYGVKGACDLSRFIIAGDMPALVFGPGNISLAHMPNEYVPIEEVVAATKVIALTILSWCNREEEK